MSTLEDVLDADLVLHVRDASHPDTAYQRADVLDVLRRMRLEPVLLDSALEVMNKSDLLQADDEGGEEGGENTEGSSNGGVVFSSRGV